MSTQLVHRPARLRHSDLTAEPLTLAPAPLVETSLGGGAMVMRAMIPMFAALGMVLMMIASGSVIRMIAGGAMVLAAIGGAIMMIIYSRTGARRKAEHQRDYYIRYAAQTQDEIDAEGDRQRAEAVYRHPDPLALPSLVSDPTRLWERRRADDDFLVARIGTGVGALAREIKIRDSDDPLRLPEPISQAYLDRLRSRAERIDDLPIAVPVRGVVSVVGPADQTGHAVRAMLTQLMVFHAPDDVGVHIAVGGTDLRWALWAPHVVDSARFDGPLGRRQFSHTTDDATGLLDELTERKTEIHDAVRGHRKDTEVDRRTLVVALDADSPHGREILAALPEMDILDQLRVAVIVTTERREREPGHVDTRVTVDPEGAVRVEFPRGLDTDLRSTDTEIRHRRRLARGADRGSLDRVPPTLAEAVSRHLAPLRLVDDAVPDAPLEATVALDALLGINDFAHYDITDQWKPRTPKAFLNVPFAVDAAGRPVALDLKESAQEGMGPHGLCIGATGSGKSEVLRTLVLAQSICHSPERLALVLVDYKGGAAFAGLDALPHTAAMVDNLSDDDGLVDRLHDALLGEIQRRQHVLSAAGSLPNATEYNRRRDAGADLEALPNLFVVIDEFGEILTAKPDFIDLFVQIGRIGRSIGVHLLLATQRLEEGKLRGLESHLSYRIGLRTFSAQESRTVIGTTDAHELPPVPGSGILKVDPDVFERFRSAYVSGTYVAPADAEAAELPPVAMPFGPDNSTAAWLEAHQQLHAPSLGASQFDPGDPFTDTTLDLVARRLSTAGKKVAQIWLPPLPAHTGLETVLRHLTTSGPRGLQAGPDTGHATLAFPLGIKDDPLRQWQGPLTLDTAGSRGHVAILGAPQSGKTTALRALVCGAALTHTPAEVGFYLIDMTGSALSPMAELPHVGDVATRFDGDKIRRTVAEIAMVLAERERLFDTHQIDSVEAMRELHRRGGLPEVPTVDVYLVIDGWITFREDYDDLVATIQEIGARGLGYGVHLVLATGRWADIRIQMQAVIGTVVELRLNDPLDSTIGRKIVDKIPDSRPGRCATADGLLSQICQPRWGEDLPGVDALAAAARDAWTGPVPPRVRMLPEDITYTQMRADAGDRPSTLIGVAERDLQPVRIDLFGTEQHLLVFGESGSGRTSLAKTIITDSMRGYREGEVIYVVADIKRQMLEFVPEAYDGAYAGTTSKLAAVVQDMTGELDRRLPPDDVTTTQLRERSWWSGPEIVLVVDDYDLIEGASSPLRPLVPYLPQSRDLGLHLVVLRRAGGAGRAMYEPVIQALKENGATGLLLSGDRQEGQIWPKVWMAHRPPGRGTLIRRDGRTEMIHLARYSGDIAITQEPR